jgi:hypothetical protein
MAFLRTAPCERVNNSYSPLKQQNPSHATLGAEVLISQGIIWRAEKGANHSIHSRQGELRKAIPFDVSEIDTQLPSGGLVCGAIHEFYYQDSTNLSSIPSALPAFFVARTIHSYCSTPLSSWERESDKTFPFLIVWIGKRSWPTPFSLPFRFLNSCIFIDPPTDTLTLWTIETALRSPAVKLVISDCPRISLTTTKRLCNAAKAHNSTALLLRQYKDLDLPSSASTKWLISPTPSPHHFPLWRLSLERIKGGSPSIRSWIVGLESGYEEREKISLRVFSPLVDRGHEEETTLERFGT